MVVATSLLKRAGAADDAAPADVGQAGSRSLLTVQLQHSCKATACSDVSCTLCSNSILRACSSELKQKYVAGSALQAPCGAWPVLELLSSQPGVLDTVKCQLKISLIDDVKYQNLCLAGAPPAGDRLADCLADDAGLKHKGLESAEVVVPVEDGKAKLTDLFIYKVPGGRSGHSTYYRLLFTTLLDLGSSTSTQRTQRQSGPSAAPTAAPLLTEKLQLITTRSKCNEKSDVLHASQSVRRVQAVGEGFAKVLADLKEAVPAVPAELASVTKVGEFHRLVKWVKQTANTSVPNLFRPNDWARSSQHVLSALLEDDTRQRLWFPSVSGAGLLFQCQQGAVRLAAPASFALMLGGRLVLRPLSQLAPVQLQQLLQKAKEDWRTAGHPNWSVYDEEHKGPAVPEQTAGRAATAGAGLSAGASKPQAVLARAAVAAAFGAVAGVSGTSHKPGFRRKLAARSCSKRASIAGNSSSSPSTPSQPSSPVMLSAAAAAGTTSPHSTDSTSEVAEMPVLDLAAPEPTGSGSAAAARDKAPGSATAASDKAPGSAACDKAPAPEKAASLAGANGAAVSTKRRQQRGQQEYPVKKLRLRLVSQRQRADPQPGQSAAEEPAAAEDIVGEAHPAPVEAAATAEGCSSPKQQGCDEQQVMTTEDAEMVDDILEQLMYDGMSDDWSSDLEGDLVADLEADPHSVLMQDMQQQLQEAQVQQEAQVLKMLYKSMSDDWCSELDADLSNNLGSSFLCELQQLQEDAAAGMQQTGDNLTQEASLLVKQASLSRLNSLSELPDFSDLCDVMCLQNWSQSVEQLPIVLV